MKVDAASCRVKETEKIGVGGLTEQIVAVTVTGEGEILSGTVSARENPANAEAGNTETNITNTSYEKMTREKEQIINTRMEDYLNAIASHALEKEIDITNSYRNLGADNRTWYFKYQKHSCRLRERHQNPISGKNKLEIGINAKFSGIIEDRRSMSETRI